MKRNVPKLRFKGFDDELVNEKLGNLCKLSSGSTPSKANSKFFKGKILWVTSGELKSKYLYNTIDKITEEAKEASRLKLYKKGTFIIAIYGLEASGTRGSSTILGTDATISQACMALEPKNDLVNEYLYYWYEKNSEVIGIRYAQGTKQQNLSTDLVSNLSINLPFLQEQEKIANFLTKVDSLIEEQDGKIQDLELYKKGMMQKIFSQEIRFKDDNGREYPEWERTLGDNIFSILGGGAFKSSDSCNQGIKWFKIANVGINNIEKKEISYLSEKIKKGNDKYILESGDIVLALTRPILNNKLKISIIDDFFDGSLLNQRVGKIQPNAINSRLFIYYLLQTSENLMYLQNKLAGTDPPNLSNSDLLNKVYKLPCLEEQTKISNFLSNIDSIIEEEKNKLEDLRQWKKGLLQQMFV